MTAQTDTVGAAASDETNALVRHRGLRLLESYRARVVAAGLVCGYFLVQRLAGRHTWAWLGRPDDRPDRFGDLRTITSGWDCARRGIDVIPNNPCFPKLKYDYPRIWLLPSHLGIGESATSALGYLIAIAFFATAITLLRRNASIGAALVFGVALLSPSVILGVEHGNNDQVVFIVCVAALGLLARGRGRAWRAGSGLLLFAAILKLFPIFAIGAFARFGRRGLLWAAAVAGAFSVYVLATLSDIRKIHDVSPATLWHHIYGINQLGVWLGTQLGGISHAALDAAAVAIGAALALGLAAFSSKRTSVAQHTARDADITVAPGAQAGEWERTLFVGGACLYLGTYLYPGFRSFDYRLMFLLLAMPLLLCWLRARDVLGSLCLLAVLVALWLERPFESVRIVGWFFVRWDALTRNLPAFTFADFLLYVFLTACLIRLLLSERPRELRPVTLATSQPTPRVSATH